MSKHQPHIEARKYAEKAKSFLQLRGIKSGEYPILEKAKHSQQWSDWTAYFRSKGMLASVEMMTGDNTTKTVPSLSPSDFDPEFVRPRYPNRHYGEAAE